MNNEEKKLLTGYESVFRGAFESGASYCVIDKRLYDKNPIPKNDNLEVKIVDDEKIALSYAFGLSLSGKRTLCFLSTVPFDLTVEYGYTGINGSLIIVYLENNDYLEYDSRPFFASCNYPIFEPSSPAELKRFVKISFNFSEKYDVPVVIRVDRKLLDSFESVIVGEPKTIKDKPYKKDPSKYVLTPSTIKLCTEDVIQRKIRLATDCESFPINSVIEGNDKIGVVAAGQIANAVKETMCESSVFSLGMSNPLPIKRIKEFASSVEKLYVIEEHPFIENELRKRGIECIGENLFPRSGRRTVAEISNWILKKNVSASETKYGVRTPDFCVDCGLVPVVLAIKKKKIPVFTDNGCGVLSGCFISASEIGLRYALPTAIAFAKTTECVCLLTESEFESSINSLITLLEEIPTVVVAVDSEKYVRFLPILEDKTVETNIEDFAKIEKLERKVYFVKVDKVCKYEN